jgi:hypothetical protein
MPEHGNKTKHFIAIFITQNKIKTLISSEKQACISTAHQLTNSRTLLPLDPHPSRPVKGEY